MSQLNGGTIQIRLTDTQVEQLRNTLGRDKAEKAISSAVRRATDAGRTAADKEVAEHTTMKPKYRQRAITARVTGSGANTQGVVRISQRQVPIIGYKIKRHRNKGIEAILTKGRSGIRFHHAFVARVSNTKQAKGGGDHKGVWMRSRKVGKGSTMTARGFASRLAIEEVRGPSVLSLIGELKQTAMGERVIARTQEVFQKRLLSQVDRFMADPKAKPAE